MNILVPIGIGLLVMLSGKKTAAFKDLSPTLTPPPIPKITLPPNGRHLSPEEKTILSVYIPQVDLDGAVLWWNTPASSFASENKGEEVIALTTPRGIYLRGENHALTTVFEYVTLAHELVHVGQFRKGLTGTPEERELQAYKTGLAIEKNLEEYEAQTGHPRWT